ncbi:MAG: chemotaxis protein CheX [Polyangiaceae bacterium]
MENYAELLQRIVEATLEQMCFVCLEACEPKVPDEALTARVVFRGPHAGHFVLAVERGLLAELTENMTGGTESEESDGVLKELTNVLCGHAVVELFGSGKIFELGAPELVDQVEALQAAPIEMGFGDGRLLVRVCAERPS